MSDGRYLISNGAPAAERIRSSTQLPWRIQDGPRDPDELPTDLVLDALETHGAVLFPGMAPSTGAFLRLSSRFTDTFSSYRGGALRGGVEGRTPVGTHADLFTVTGAAQGFPIALHGEMFYVRSPPNLVWFHCLRAPAVRGETILCDGTALYARLPLATREYFRRMPILYLRRLTREEWQLAFDTPDLDGLRAACRELDLTFETHHDEAVTLRYRCSAFVRTHSGRDAFVNNVLELSLVELGIESGWTARNIAGTAHSQAPIVVRTETGERLPADLVRQIARIGEALTIEHAWQTGDVLMIDNHRVMHGRRAASGERTVHVRLGNLSRREPL